jgi:hypothetical protein
VQAFKNVLTQEQIWQIIAYLRGGFPEIDHWIAFWEDVEIE